MRMVKRCGKGNENNPLDVVRNYETHRKLNRRVYMKETNNRGPTIPVLT